MGEMDIGRAVFLASVCKETYMQFEHPDGQFLVPEGYRSVASFHAESFGGRKEIFGFVLESDRHALLAFRGTSTMEDWISDSLARQKAYPFVRDMGNTHLGFTDIYASARKQILTALKTILPDKPLSITGHSLGGALATVCAPDVAAHSPFGQPEVYTFAAPRVGDPAFARAYDKCIRASWRIYNDRDLVPKAPPFIYKSPINGKWYVYMHVKTGFSLSFDQGGISPNHVLPGYFAALEHLVS